MDSLSSTTAADTPPAPLLQGVSETCASCKDIGPCAGSPTLRKPLVPGSIGGLGLGGARGTHGSYGGVLALHPSPDRPAGR